MRHQEIVYSGHVAGISGSHLRSTLLVGFAGAHNAGKFRECDLVRDSISRNGPYRLPGVLARTGGRLVVGIYSPPYATICTTTMVIAEVTR